MGKKLTDFLIFDKDNSPYQNYTQWKLRNREFYANWIKMFGIPAAFLKIKREELNPTETNRFSKTDKFLIAWGKQGAAFENTMNETYKVFNIYAAINNESMNFLTNKWTDNFICTMSYDDRFIPAQADLICFKFNNSIYMYEIELEPKSYHDIVYEVNLKYVKRVNIEDKVEVKEDEPPTVQQKRRYW